MSVVIEKETLPYFEQMFISHNMFVKISKQYYNFCLIIIFDGVFKIVNNDTKKGKMFDKFVIVYYKTYSLI